ncbi:uncharacterized protein LOC131009778 [Salvia miltiorrhiza]|uniref:uncharacterized protein LOC131009778 n=1 Tax=Salvia miltiorrhiza TaxID=226208 RepID=UPI0025AD418F|nr:uncharacterized protein LOC131009778 [Salvia miltiorrhiza]
MNYENYDPSFPEQPVVDLYLPIWAHLPAFRHKPAFVWAEDASALTYEHLNSSVNSISSNLSLSLHKGDTVVILCEPGLELVQIIFACQRAGLIAVPVTPPRLSLPNHHHHLIRVLSQTKPSAAIASRSYIRYSSCTLSKLTWIATEDLTAPSEHCDMRRYEGCRADDAYLIQYTSGATAIPKPVIVTAGAAAHNVRAARRSYDLHPNSVIASWLPQYHDCGLMFLLLTIVSGATCVLASPTAFVARPRLWLEMITDYKATCTPVPSFALPLVVRRGGGSSRLSLATLKNLIIINEPIKKPSIDEFVQAFTPFGLQSSSISPSYGLAENCTFVSTAWRSGGGGDHFPIHKNLLPSAKLPTSREEMLEEDIEMLVVNEETHEAVDDGIEGEIWISSPGTAVGYLDHPTLTREVFNGRLRGRVGGCYVRTGDRGVVAGKERYLYVMGRCADVIKSVGIDIHPHYVEAAAHGSCPRLLRAGCVAAFEHQGVVTVVAELLKPVLESNVLVRICEGIRKAVWEEERVEVGAVVLAERRSVAKTTSGKIQRWAAKYAFERDELKEVVRMKFGDDGCNSTVFGQRKRESEEEREGIHVAAARDNGNRLSLQSSL